MTHSSRLWVFLAPVALVAVASVSHGSEEKPAEGWQKIPTQEQVMRDPRQMLTPGLFLSDLQHIVTFAADGTLVDLGLPHDGTDESGTPLPALRGAVRSNTLWLDLNSDGKADTKELAGVGGDGEAGPFTWAATYEDGTAGPYVFKLQFTGETRKFRVVRCAVKVARFGKSSLVLLDDDGNGRFNDLRRDALLVDDQPVTLLGRQVCIGDKAYELLVHSAGQLLEMRPLPAEPSGTVDMFKKYRAPQKAESLRIRTVIVAGRDSCFSFDPAHPAREVPAGAYDMVFGLFERSAEMVWMRNGERTSFQVEPGKEAAVIWGGPIKTEVEVENDGAIITAQGPVFRGVASEVYRPAGLRRTPCTATLTVMVKDKASRTEFGEMLGSARYEVLATGEWKPVKFEYTRTDDLVVSVDYKSGILGPLHGETRFKFTARKAP